MPSKLSLTALLFSSVDDKIECPAHPAVSTPVPTKTQPSVATEQPIAQVAPPVAASAAAVESVDLGKIGSILNSLSSVMKNTGEYWHLFLDFKCGLSRSILLL